MWTDEEQQGSEENYIIESECVVENDMEEELLQIDSGWVDVNDPKGRTNGRTMKCPETWLGFLRSEFAYDAHRRHKAKCMYCGTEVLGVKPNMNNHRSKCPHPEGDPLTPARRKVFVSTLGPSRRLTSAVVDTSSLATPSSAKRIKREPEVQETKIRMVIYAEHNPDEMISREQYTWLEEAILDAVCLDNSGQPISFAGINYKPGLVQIDCEDEYSAEWLQLNVPSLDGWTGPSLKVTTAAEAPQTATISISFPKSADKADEKVLEMLRAQNRGLNTRYWKVLKAANEEGEGKRMVLLIDDDSHTALETKNFVVNYRYGKIRVSKIKS